eukprot:TRINITY_DN25447_c0_g1_i2.p1 TRINITY_DN25447_c0_g1~~TRINITY_DN25447_c0_g1_i2.p1  ORF type:complete len:1082 (-),score=155.97 TRINITY_DN25447_c0_g1_i2:283-3528(-)
MFTYIDSIWIHRSFCMSVTHALQISVLVAACLLRLAGSEVVFEFGSETVRLPWVWNSQQPFPQVHAAVGAAYVYHRETRDQPITPSHYKQELEAAALCPRHGLRPRQRPTRLIDAALFDGELDLLQARLNELYDWTDKFVLVELGRAATGSNKEGVVFAECLAQPWCGTRFAQFLDKIIYIYTESTESCTAAAEAQARDAKGRPSPALSALCEGSHWDALSDGLAADTAGHPGDVVMFSNGDEFTTALTASVAKLCEKPSKAQVPSLLYYYSAHCRCPERWIRGTKILTVAECRKMGGHEVRKADVRAEGWHSLATGGYRLGHFQWPEQVAARFAEMADPFLSTSPFTAPGWHHDNAKMCVFNVGSAHVQCEAVEGHELTYPDLPWYVLENKASMQRFFDGGGDLLKEREDLHSVRPSLAICITGQLRGMKAWNELRAVTVAWGRRDIFAVVPPEDCPEAEAALGRREAGYVSCAPDDPLSPAEEQFVKLGPRLDFMTEAGDHRRAHVLQYRAVATCRMLIEQQQLLQGKRYDWIMRKRADVLLRSVPTPADLLDQSIYLPYRDKDLHLGALNDKILLGPPDLMQVYFKFYDMMLDPTYWPTWRWLCSISTLGGALGYTFERLYLSYLANVTGPAEALLHSYFLIKDVPSQTHRLLRYDIVPRHNTGGESSSPETFIGNTGVFGAVLNDDNFGNAYPRDPYLSAPLVTVMLLDAEQLGRKPVVLDAGCGSGQVAEMLIGWDIPALCLDGNSQHWKRAAFYGILGDLSRPLDEVEEVGSKSGLLHSRTGELKYGAKVNHDALPQRPDWVLSFDVVSYMPPEHQSMYMLNIMGYAERGVILRIGNGPFPVEEERLREVIVFSNFSRDFGHERTFALFSSLIGPDKGPVLVYAAKPHVGTEDLHVPSAGIVEMMDIFEPNHQAAHFVHEEAVWLQAEVEIAISYVRLFRAYLQPEDGWHILWPLRLPPPMGYPQTPKEERAWGLVTWDSLAAASWNVGELLELILAKNASILDGLVTAAQIEALSARRHANASLPPSGDFLSNSRATSLNVVRSLAATLEAGGRPRGLHRQTWLSRLATRFRSG